MRSNIQPPVRRHFFYAAGVAVVALATALSVCLLVPGSALAAACGDDVEGQRVACACGDVLVSSATLRGDDPVVADAPCSHNGLTIRAARGAAAVILDLGGNSLLGSGLGTGVNVVSGGVGGALVRGGAGSEIVGFTYGLRAGGSSGLARVEDLGLRANRRDGLVARGDGVELVNVSSSANGRHGLDLGGSNGVLRGVSSTGNLKSGARLAGTGNSVQAYLAGNGEQPRLRASGNDLSGVENDDSNGEVAR
jgi:hypothetical protein